ncbi:MAG: sigma-70 family RNA polymerase sigma factor [Bacteroidaceae bacterium]|nr:sigma-70 family RNA polymerase sigma factor [Bacteroidaceae bacterium]
MTPSEYITHVAPLRPLLLGVGRNFFHSEEEAEDAVQETLLRLWLCRDRLAADDSLRPMALRVARNVCVSMWRKARLRETLTLEEGHTATRPATDQADSRLLADDRQFLLDMALRRLSPSERRLFLLRQEPDMNLDLMARITGMQPRSISSKLSAARRKVYDFIKQRL